MMTSETAKTVSPTPETKIRNQKRRPWPVFDLDMLDAPAMPVFYEEKFIDRLKQLKTYKTSNIAPSVSNVLAHPDSGSLMTSGTPENKFCPAYEMVFFTQKVSTWVFVSF